MYWYSKKLGKKFYYKIPALRADPNVTFHLDDIYDDYDWSVEPLESWDEIKWERAWNLRDKAGYLRLWYSGGSDSQTILNTFIKHNIPLDEIGIWRLSPINDFNTPANDEINKAALPYLETIKDKLHPSTKIVLYDVGYEQLKYFYTNHSDPNTHNNFLDFRPCTSVGMHKLFPNVNKKLNLLNIDGLEKPKVGVDKNGPFWYYSDANLLMHIVDPKEKIPNVHFFLDPKIHCKQIHMKIHNDYYDDDIIRDDIYKNFSLGKATYKTVAPKTLLSLSEAKGNSKSYHLYKQYIESFDAFDVNESLLLDINNPQIGFKHILTNKYYL